MIALSSAASAQQGKNETPGQEWFQQMDANGDGRISRADAGEKEFFDRADANSNGFVTQREATLFAQRQNAKTTETGSDELLFPPNLQTVAAK